MQFSCENYLKYLLLQRLVYLPLLTSVFACDAGLEPAVNMINNPGMEQVSEASSLYPAGWQLRAYRFSPPNNYLFGRQEGTAAEGEASVMVGANATDSDDEYFVVRQEIRPEGLDINGPIEFLFHLKADALAGQQRVVVRLLGISPAGNRLELLYNVPEAELTAVSESWQQYRFPVPALEQQTERIIVELGIGPQTTGKLYIDNVQLWYVPISQP